MLRLEEVSKWYRPPPVFLKPFIRVAAKKPVEALRGISFQMSPGEIVGLVGPNGAGKTTLMRIIAGLLEPSSGQVFVNGHDVAREGRAVRPLIGLLLEADRGFYRRLTGRQNLEFFAINAGLSRASAARRVSDLLDTFDLTGRDKLLFGYSSGMKVRLGMARALLADPPLLVLDEPTRSLDPLASFEVGSMLRDLANQGRAILFSDHRLDELLTVCDRIVVLVNGQVAYQGTPRSLEVEGNQAAAAIRQLMRDSDSHKAS